MPTTRPRREVPVAPLSSATELSAGASVVTLDSTEIMASFGESFSAMLAARVPGLSVLRSGGSAAEGSRVRLRGPRSFLVTTEPIVIVDGIRVNAMQEAVVIDVGTRVSRLDDIALEDVARIDVLPGPAAASLFGPGAAGGALVITTKRGHVGSVSWTGRAESRVGFEPRGFPANYRMNGISTANGQPAASCDRLQVASGACTPTTLDVWNPLEQASPFRTGRTAAGSMSLAGGVGQTAARIAASGHRTLGVTGDDDGGRLGLRANVVHQLSDAIDFAVHGGYTRTSAGLPTRGNNVAGLIASGLFGQATDDSARGYRFPNQPGDTRQRATHWLAGATAAWRPRSWLTATAVFGRDQLDQRDDFLQTINNTSGGASTFTERGEVAHATTTLGTSAAASYVLSRAPWIGGKTIVGYERLGSAHTVSDSQTFSDRQTTLPPLSSLTFIKHDWTIGGPWLRQQLVLNERVFVNGAVRLEQRRAFGAKLQSEWFKSADASWLMGRVGRVEALRLRVAYGEGGSWMAGNPGLAATVSSLPDASMLEPAERTAESEVGVDAGIGERLTLALTAFRADASKLYVFGPLPASLGFQGAILTAAGSMRNDGLELIANARLLDRSGLRWDATLTGATLRNRVGSIGGGPPIVGTDNRTAPGYPVRGYWMRPYTYTDTNGDGIIDVTEIHFGDTAVFAGSSLPTREASLHSALSLPGRLTAAVLLDYRGGHKLANSNERIRCRLYGNCRAAQDPATPLAEQARFAASRTAISDPFVEDASFVKLRELSLRWTVPTRWATYVGGGSATVTLAGRNLATWTRYTGIDPELDYRRFDDLPRAELGKSPVVRELVLRLDLGGGSRR